MWATHCFSGQDFALCGKTILSLQRNLLEPLLPILRGMGYRCRFAAGRRVLTVGLGRRENRFYLFGGRDEAAPPSSRASPWPGSCWMRSP